MTESFAAIEASAAASTAHGTWALFGVTLLAALATLGAVIVALLGMRKATSDARERRDELCQQSRYAAEIAHMEIGRVPTLLEPSRLTKTEELETQEQRLQDARSVLTVLLSRELPAPYVFSLVEMSRLVDTAHALLANAKEFPGGYRNDGGAHTSFFNQSTGLLGLSDDAIRRLGEAREIVRPVALRIQDLQRMMQAQAIADQTAEDTDLGGFSQI